MRELKISMNPNKLVKYFRKPTLEFTKYDIIKFIEDHNIEMLNFRYVSEDGRLKALNFVIISKEFLESILSTGERVDGSSLFSYIHADHGDLYVIPRFNTAFVNPFSEVPTLEILCSFYTKHGEPLESAPEYILKKAYNSFKEETGHTFSAMGELEYYIIGKKNDLYPAVNQKGYHSTAPFAKYEKLRLEAMQLIAQCGGRIKYGHAEVGSFNTDTHYYEQHEIEFLPVHPSSAVEQLMVAKWILRNLGKKYDVAISFAPKIVEGKAGSGLHIHMQIEKDGINVMANDFDLTNIAKKMISGLLDKAPSLTAFGNTVPTSYLRLVPHQEAPTMVCWGYSNRAALVRVPLGWIAKTNMIRNANPQEIDEIQHITGKQTIELRVPDGSADLYHLLAGIILAAKDGVNSNDSLNKAEARFINVNIFKKEHKAVLNKLKQLPDSCYKSALALEKDREFYEANGIFPKGTIDRFIEKLKSYNDDNLSEKLYGNKKKINKLVDKYIHCS